jgi:phosphohistidine phosphatase
MWAARKEAIVDLYLIRHGEAVPLGEEGTRFDEERPLTEAGVAQCHALAAALQRQGVHLDAIITSPLVRARQTTEALLQAWQGAVPEVIECDGLIPEVRPRKLTRFVRERQAESVALVGHLPDLGIYAGWLIGSKRAQVDLAKAGTALIKVEGKLGKRSGALQWLVTPEWCASTPNPVLADAEHPA